MGERVVRIQFQPGQSLHREELSRLRVKFHRAAQLHSSRSWEDLQPPRHAVAGDLPLLRRRLLERDGKGMAKGPVLSPLRPDRALSPPPDGEDKGVAFQPGLDCPQLQMAVADSPDAGGLQRSKLSDHLPLYTGIGQALKGPALPFSLSRGH